MALLPVLHAAQAVTQASGPNLAIAAAVAGTSAALITFAALWLQLALRRRAPRRRAALVAGGLLTLLALTPSIVPLDHLWQMTALAGAHAGVHASHCHDAPASCSDTPVTAGPGQLMAPEPLIIVPAMLATLLLLAIAPLTSITRRPRLRPPLALACRP